MDFLKKIFIFLGIALGVVALLAGVVYLFYWFALFSRKAYSIFFLCCVVGVVVFLIVRAVKRKKIAESLHKASRFMIKMVLVFAAVSAAALYGAFLMRYPLLGLLAAPVMVFFGFFVLPRLNIIKSIKKYLS
ncbi:MAG: hypothetical protein ACOC7U_05280 [Spirochaetota bacterium]